MNSATTTATANTTPASAPKKAARKPAQQRQVAAVPEAVLNTEPKTSRGTSSGARPGISQNINSTRLLHEEDLKAISSLVLSAVMEKIIPLLEKIEQINKTTDLPVVKMSAEQTAAKQLQQQLQTMAQMKLKSLEDRVTHRIRQMQGK